MQIDFGSSQPLVSLKIKTVASLIRETWAITPTNLLKENLTYSLIFKAYFIKIFAAAKASLVFIKNKCRSSHWQMFFKIGALKNFAIITGKHLCQSLILIKSQALRCFPVNITKFLRAVIFIEHLRWLLLQMFCFRLYFQKDVAEYIVGIHCIIVSFWNLKSISFTFIHFHLLYHLLSLVVIHCHSLSLVVPLVVTRCYSFSFVVICCTTRYHSLSLDVPLVCLFINDPHF